MYLRIVIIIIFHKCHITILFSAAGCKLWKKCKKNNKKPNKLMKEKKPTPKYRDETHQKNKKKTNTNRYNLLLKILSKLLWVHSLYPALSFSDPPFSHPL